MSKFNPFDPLADITPRFTEEQLAEIVEWFDENAKPNLLIDDQPTNAVTIEQFIDFLKLKKFHKRHFKYPSYYEIMAMAEKLKAGVTRMITKDQLIYILDSFILDPHLRHEIILAFKLFDTESRNYLETDDIGLIVTSYADPFTEDETQEILRDANVRGDGIVFYEDFVESMFSVAPELNELKAEFLYDDPNEDPSVIPEPEPEPEPETIVEELPPPPPPPPQPKKGGKKKKL